MSTLVATYHIYRPRYLFNFRDKFFYLYIYLQRQLTSILIRAEAALDSDSLEFINLPYLEREARETDGQASSFSPSEVGLAGDTLGAGFTGGNKPGKKKKPEGMVNKIKNYKKQIAVTVSVIGATGAIVGAIIVAPSFLLTHVSSMFMDKAGDLQARQSATFRRSKYSKFTDRFSIDGRRGSAVIKEMERFGYRFEFDGTDKTKIGKITKQGNPIDPADFDKEISGFLDKRFSFFGVSSRSGRWKSKRMEAFYSRYKVVRSAINAKSPDDLEDVQAEANSRQFEAIDGEDDVKTNVEPRREDFPDNDEGKDAFDQAQKDFDDLNATNPDSPYSGAKEQLADGVDEKDIPLIANAGEEFSEGNPNGLKTAIGEIDDVGFSSKSFGIIKGLGVVTDPGDKICSAGNSMDVAIKTARFLTSVKLMRATLAFVTADDGQRKGEASADLTKQLLKRITLSDKVLGSFGSSQGYNSTMKGTLDKNKNAETRTSFATDGRSAGFWGGLRGILKFPGNETACPVIQNPAFQIGQVVGMVVISVFNFGGGTAAEEGAVQAARVGLEQTFAKFLAERTLSRLALDVGIDVAKGVALDVGFDQILGLTQLYVQKQLDIPFTGQEVGGRYSAMLFSGAGVMHKQRNLKSGFIPATKSQFAAAQSDYLAEVASEKANKSFAERMFNFKDSDSLAYQAFADVAFKAASPSQTVNEASTNLANIGSFVASGLLSPLKTFTGIAHAQSVGDNFETIDVNGTELATDPYGNLEPIMPEWLLNYSDPAVEAENTQFLINSGDIDETTKEPKSEQFKKHMENCVDSPDTIGSLEDGDASSVESDCLATQALTRRFKGHLINLDSGDYLDAELFPEEISTAVVDTSAGSTTPGVPNGSLPTDLIQGTPVAGQDTSSTPCPSSPTVRDLGIETEAYISGTRYSIRLCSVHGVRVNSIIAKQYDDMFNAMATVGYTVQGSGGFRDMAGQVRGYNGGKGAGTYARPGYSNHQFGTAVDISCQGGGTSYSQGTGRGRTSFLAGVSRYPCLQWIASNSSTYNLLLQCVGASSKGIEIRATSGGCEWWHVSPTGG